MGKTSIINKYTTGEFSKDHMPKLGLDFASKTIHPKDGVEIKMKIWDTAG